ncbi:MAG: hypothetical protein M1831_004179 [Alyxoria varia]|nr:MAG: hypothetical protein M1831_004179 [Alyxoria varia]
MANHTRRTPVRFQPLRISKRKWRQPWIDTEPQSPNYDERQPDLEKHSLIHQDDSHAQGESSNTSSRSTSNSYTSTDPILQRTPDHHLKGKQQPSTASAYAPQRQFKRRCNQYFTFILGGALIVFLFTLLQLAFSSAREVEQGTRKPEPKPPPWQDFPLLARYYGGIGGLTKTENYRPEYPGTGEDVVRKTVGKAKGNRTESETAAEDDESDHQQEKIKFRSQSFDPKPLVGSLDSEAKDCFFDSKTETRMPKLQVYQGTVQGFPRNVLGSREALNSSSDICLDRFGKLGPYGFGYSQKLGGIGSGMEADRKVVGRVWEDDPEIDFRDVRWAQVQDDCLRLNNHTFGDFKPSEGNSVEPFLEKRDAEADASPKKSATPAAKSSDAHKPITPRTAILIRATTNSPQGPAQILHYRSLISELSLASSGEYTVHFLIKVLDSNLPVWSDEATRLRVLSDALPEEFHGMATLWSEEQMHLLYSGVQQTSEWMPVQWFARNHPEFEYFWDWDPEMRYTGHYLQLLKGAEQWATQQPRKYLWERNAKFYVPDEHGSWEEFVHMIRVQTEQGISSNLDKVSNRLGGEEGGSPANAPTRSHKSIWGPQPPPNEPNRDNFTDIVPPTSFESDKSFWGIDEPSELITLAPIFDPDSTSWSSSTEVSGYNLDPLEPLVAGPDIHGGAPQKPKQRYPPRRASLSSVSRISLRLLTAMHNETAFEHKHMNTQMWPASLALQKGYKAVHVPHPIYVDRKWPTAYLASVFAGPEGRRSVYAEGRSHNFKGLSIGVWGADGDQKVVGDFASRLYRRWLGYKDQETHEGGEEWETEGEGRMCLPPMLLGPVGGIGMVFEHRS